MRTKKRQPEELIGQKYGSGKVIKYIGIRYIGRKYKRGYYEYELLCDCGNKYITTEQHLLGGRSNSCGCLRRTNLLNKKFGKLTVDKFAGHHITKGKGRKKILWECKCECGNTVNVTADSLLIGDTVSCGCISSYFHSSCIPIKKSICRYTKCLKSGANRRKLCFDITGENLIQILISQNGKCALSGINISFEDGIASVDRIDNTLGYTIQNIQIVHRKINYMKNSLSNNEFVELCNSVTLNNRENHASLT